MEIESGGEFESWLCTRLKGMGLDEDVFGSYVTGILDEEESNDEDRQDGLVGILEGMTEVPAEEVSAEILRRWKLSRADLLKKRQDAKEQEAEIKRKKLSEIMEKQAATKSAAKTSKFVDADLKLKLLNEYGHQSEDDYFDSEEEHETIKDRPPPRLTGNESNLFKNTNTQSVLEKEKEKRDKVKNESDQKKQQIKDAKEKQKQKVDDRKDKEKKRTQKAERRR